MELELPFIHLMINVYTIVANQQLGIVNNLGKAEYYEPSREKTNIMASA